MTRSTGYLALALLGLTGCDADSVREASAQQRIPTVGSDSDIKPASSPPQAYELRRVWSGGRFSFYWTEPSPDGRYLSEIDWNGFGDLAVRDLMTGEIEPVTHLTKNQEAFAYGSVFSPDGKRLAYRWYLYEGDENSLRTIGVDGSDERILVAHRPDVMDIVPTDWSPDGQHILGVVHRPDDTRQLALIAVADGSIRVLKSLGWSWEWDAEALFSPDGRYVAYTFGQVSSVPGADPMALRILAVDGSQEVEVAPHSSDQSMLGWTPDGRAVLFYRPDRSSGSIWQAPIENGRPVGDPILIESDVNLTSIGFSRDAYFFGTVVESVQMNTAMIDPEGGGFVTPPRPMGDPGTSTHSGAWSMDGEQLAYVKSQPTGPVLVVRAVDGREERDVPLSTLEEIRQLVWAPDGESVLVVARGKGRLDVGYAAYRVDLGSGNATFLFNGPRAIPGLSAAPDGKTLYVGRVGEGVVSYDVSTGEQTLLYADSVDGFSTAVSPDGRMLAITTYPEDNRILVMPRGGRAGIREVFGAQGYRNITGAWWTEDGRSLLFMGQRKGGEPWVLSRISIDGGPVTDLLEIPCDPGCGSRQLTVHPDGRRIMLRQGRGKAEIWMITGFGATHAGSGETVGR